MSASRDVESWSRALVADLGLDTAPDVAAVLDLARIAAHGVARPAAPLTTYLAGYAAARGVPLVVVVAAVERRLAEDAP
ncbi:DUF6457 domain-containing protein [Agromyces cerinus]|uniref:DUF6457 domain-containing protein n=1 Tax=Agromyces cerinus subsp. cerinus TaxID=232089 RepID=A0A1N6DMD9_9MICO|nr:DUF6457 domain-containing protein [Agromyces cerinus]SIN71920.1 hypothetical protein SAMN05443544_0467 [Agromyces cerinus subsp. cerinus]